MGSTVFASITTPGPAGPPGRTALWLTGAVAPVTAQGLDGDMFLNSTTGDVYGPKSGTWGGIVANIKGTTGATGAAGPAGYSPLYIVAAGPPATVTGNNGDMYLNSTTQDLYGPKTAGVWGGIIANIKGTPGTAGATGPQGPPGVAYTPRGAWNSATTYVQGDMVSDANIVYIALQSANTNHVPISSPTWWQAAASGGSQTPWNSDIDGNTKLLNNVNGIGINCAASNLIGLRVFNASVTDVIQQLSSNTTQYAGSVFQNDLGHQFSFRIFASANPTTPDVVCLNASGCPFTFSTNNVERMRITAAGNVGIGTAGPQETLQVQGAVRVGSTAFAPSGFTFVQDANGHLQIQYKTAPSTVFTNVMALTYDGKVGVGSVLPTSAFVVVGGGSSGNANDASLNYNAPNTIQFTSGVPGVSLAGGVQTATPNGFWLQVRSSNSNGLSYPLLLNPSGGNVGIGTTNPQAGLEVNSGVRISGGSSPGLGAGIEMSYAGGRGGLIVYDRSAGAFKPLYFKGSAIALNESGEGNVGIGTTAPAGTLGINTPYAGVANTAAVFSCNYVNAGDYNQIVFSDGQNTSAIIGAAIRSIRYATADFGGSLAFCCAQANTDASPGTLKERMRICANGSVGINVDPGVNSAYSLSVQGKAGAAHQVQFLANGAQDSYIMSGGSNGLGLLCTFGSTGDMALGFYGITASALYMYRAGAVGNTLVLNAGRVGIGTIPATYALEILGDVNITGTYRVGGVPISGGGGITTQSIVTGSRALNTAYRNTTGKSMLVTVAVNMTAGSAVTVLCDSAAAPASQVAFASISSAASGGASVSFWVLNNYYYKVNAGGSISSWVEWT